MYDNNLIILLYSNKNYIIENYRLYDAMFKKKYQFGIAFI